MNQKDLEMVKSSISRNIRDSATVAFTILDEMLQGDQLKNLIHYAVSAAYEAGCRDSNG